MEDLKPTGPDTSTAEKDREDQDKIQGRPENTPPKKRKRTTAQKKEPAFKAPWEKEYYAYFKHMLNNSNAKKAIKLLRTLECTDNFTISPEQTLVYKKSNLGNIFLIMYFFFSNDKSESKMSKKINQLKKALNAEKIHV
jgi:hypothetical protein